MRCLFFFFHTWKSRKCVEMTRAATNCECAQACGNGSRTECAFVLEKKNKQKKFKEDFWANKNQTITQSTHAHSSHSSHLSEGDGILALAKGDLAVRQNRPHSRILLGKGQTILTAPFDRVFQLVQGCGGADAGDVRRAQTFVAQDHRVFELLVCQLLQGVREKTNRVLKFDFSFSKVKETQTNTSNNHIRRKDGVIKMLVLGDTFVWSKSEKSEPPKNKLTVEALFMQIAHFSLLRQGWQRMGMSVSREKAGVSGRQARCHGRWQVWHSSILPTCFVCECVCVCVSVFTCLDGVC